MSHKRDREILVRKYYGKSKYISYLTTRGKWYKHFRLCRVFNLPILNTIGNIGQYRELGYKL